MWEKAFDNLGAVASTGILRPVTEYEAAKQQRTHGYSGSSFALTGGQFLTLSATIRYDAKGPTQAPVVEKMPLLQALAWWKSRPLFLCDIAKGAEVAWLIDGLSLIFFAALLLVNSDCKENPGKLGSHILRPQVGDPEAIFKFFQEEAATRVCKGKSKKKMSMSGIISGACTAISAR